MMSKSLTRGKLKTPKRRDRIAEYSGSITGCNYWIKIGIDKRQLALLSKLSKQWGVKKSPTATAARMLITLGLAALPTIEECWRKFERYCEMEDLHFDKFLNARARHWLNKV